jgi:hypothetical protein
MKESGRKWKGWEKLRSGRIQKEISRRHACVCEKNQFVKMFLVRRENILKSEFLRLLIISYK